MRYSLRSPTEWYKWFAWRPKIIENKIIWLEYAERKLLYYDWRIFFAPHEYRVFPVLTPEEFLMRQ